MVSLGVLGWIGYCAGDAKWDRCEELELNCPYGQSMTELSKGGTALPRYNRETKDPASGSDEAQ
jgi:hypothetical protein